MRNLIAFTLLEMLVTISIIAIVAAISLPSFTHFIDRNNDEALKLQLLSIIQFTQQEAQSTHQTIILCKSMDHKTCSGNWGDGQLVMSADQNKILTSAQPATKHGTIIWRAFPYYQPYIEFSPTGLLSNNNGTFIHCHLASPKPIWAIILNKSGRARVAYQQDLSPAEFSCNAPQSSISFPSADNKYSSSVADAIFN